VQTRGLNSAVITVFSSFMCFLLWGIQNESTQVVEEESDDLKIDCLKWITALL
jgi:hypothetical protein